MTAAFAIPRQRPLDEPRLLLRALTEDDLVRGHAPPPVTRSGGLMQVSPCQRLALA
jgi:hypothetical protein